jgi:hypothetical protein
LHTPLPGAKREIQLAAREWSFEKARIFCEATNSKPSISMYRQLGKRAVDLAFSQGDLRGARKLMRRR